MEKGNRRSAEKIIVVYDDGSAREITKGCCWNLPVEVEGDSIELSVDMVNCSGNDLALIISASMQLGYQLGLFREENVDGEEDDLL